MKRTDRKDYGISWKNNNLSRQYRKISLLFFAVIKGQLNQLSLRANARINRLKVHLFDALAAFMNYFCESIFKLFMETTLSLSPLVI